MNKTVERKTYIIDAEGQILGRLATRVADILRGKIKADFVPNEDRGDNVVVLNASKIKVTGNKLLDKAYYHYSGYPGGMKKKILKDVMEKDPSWVIQNAVKGMLPKNKLQKVFLKKLEVFSENEYKEKGNEIKL
uniref:Large ribosomal subunit protein uL13 n=1 Tax=candidate division CPR3 bacterium TaxID=2268181 RepID=A0A7C4R5H3_UNCC3